MIKAAVVAPGEGRFIAVGSAGTGVTVKASGAETGDLCTVWEGRVPPGTVGAGPHYHRGRDEFSYVLEGELVLRVGNETHTPKPAPSRLSRAKRSTAFTTRAVRARSS